jgi:hypothetical protein
MTVIAEAPPPPPPPLVALPKMSAKIEKKMSGSTKLSPSATRSRLSESQLILMSVPIIPAAPVR